MINYLIRRILSLIPILVFISFVSFSLLYFLPGDPALTIVGENATVEQVEAMRVQLGLDKPFHEQFFNWFLRVLQGDFGESIYSNRPVIQLISERLMTTVSLVICSAIMSLLIGLPAGVISAVKRNTITDHLVRVISLLGISIPRFWSGLMAILVLGVYLRWFPVSNFVALNENLFQGLFYLILPSVVLGAAFAALIARMVRSSMLEVMQQDYIKTAHAKGLARWVVVKSHALKNAMLPVVTIVGLNIGRLLGGTVVIETIFTMPGVGRLLILSIYRRDYPVVQGVILYISLLYALVNLLVDLIYGYIDPRIKYT